MIKSVKNMKRNVELVIDLTGPDGNAFVLMGYARRLCAKFGPSYEDIKKDMLSGDYEHLIQVLEKNFGDKIIMYR